MSQPPEETEKPATTDGSDLINWAVEQYDKVRNGQLDAEGIKNLVSEAGAKISSLFNRS